MGQGSGRCASAKDGDGVDWTKHQEARRRRSGIVFLLLTRTTC